MIHAPSGDVVFAHVPAARGLAWWGQGWSSFLRAPWAWVGMTLALLLGSMLLHLLPLGAVVAQALSMPLFTLGAVFASVLRRRWKRARDITPQGLAAEADNEGALGESSRQWGARFGQLLLASLLVLGMAFALLVLLGAALAGLFGIGLLRLESIGHMMQSSPGELVAGGAGLLLVAALLLLLVLLVCSVGFWFVGTLVSLGGADAWTAVKLSLRAAYGNLGALLLFTILLIPLTILAMIPMGLGLLILLPVLSGASYASYAEVFDGARADA